MIFPRQSSLRNFVPLLLLLPILLGAFTAQLKAQQDPPTLDPADIFFQAWLEIKRAEKLENEAKFSEAWQKYRQAANYYDVLNEFHKSWKPNLVQSRMNSTAESMKKIEPKASAELASNRKKTQDLIESPNPSLPSRNGAGTGYKITPPTRTSPPGHDSSANLSRLKRLEEENKELRAQREALLRENKNFKALEADASLKDQERKKLEDTIKKKDKEIAMIRDVLARAPLQQDMNNLTQKNKTLEQEIQITARALKSSEDKLKEAELNADNFRQEAELAKNRLSKIENDMKAQKNADNQVIVKLREELKAVTGMLEQTRQELGQANKRINQMQRSLNESQATIEELTRQRDSLRLERDTLASILKKSDSQGVQDLIAENMRLGTELKEASARLEFLEKSHNTTKDDLVKARNDLTIAKSRILGYQKQQESQDSTIKSLENQLRVAETTLANQEANPDRNTNEEEVKTLRGTVQRLLAAQERRRMGEQILWDTYQKSKVKIDGLGKAIEDIRNIKIKLTEEEEKFVASHRRPDQEFKSPQRVSMTHALKYGSKLAEETKYVEGLIIRHFQKGRTQAAHSVLIDINERVPGNYRILCNLGVVEMKLGNYEAAIECLDEAITMRENSSYAHFMLGIAKYKNSDLDAALNCFERSLALKPDNARAHLYLGNLAGAAKRFDKAEEHFLSTIELDPTLADAYYNLAVLYEQQTRNKDALSYYQKALDNGAQPDQALEKKLLN